MKQKIYKGGVDNYPLWWYGQSNRLQNFGDRPNFLAPHGAVFQKNGYYFNSDNSDYLKDAYGRYLIKDGSNGMVSLLYLTNGAVPPCGSIVGSGGKIYLSDGQTPLITGKIILFPEYCPNLYYVRCCNNQVSTLDISRMEKISFLVCDNNLISILDVKQLKDLLYLRCYGNEISVLNISQATDIYSVYCNDNQIATLDVSNNSKITTLDCHNNLMDSAAVDIVLMDADTWGTSGGTIDISGNAVPGPDGDTAKTNLVNRSWSVTVDS